jgi:urease accessory protein
VPQALLLDLPGVATPAPPGTGRLGVARRASGSVVTRAYATSPLRLLTPANHGHAAWVYTSSYGGGLVDGDRIVIDAEIGAGAAAFLSTQASTKAYRSPRGTSAVLAARVEADALLVVAPDPVVCFAGARYRQEQRFDVAEGGALVVVDCVLCGRRASGERWAFSEYSSLILITTGGRLLVHDAVALRASDGELPRRLGRFNVLAVALVVGRPLRGEAEAIVAAVSRAPLVRGADELIAASPIGPDACIVRIAGTSGERVGHILRELLRFVPARLGDDPWRRKR